MLLATENNTKEWESQKKIPPAQDWGLYKTWYLEETPDSAGG